MSKAILTTILGVTALVGGTSTVENVSETAKREPMVDEPEVVRWYRAKEHEQKTRNRRVPRFR